MAELIKILIADDHPVFRMGLKQAIESIEDFSVIAEAGDGEEALAKIQSLKPDIAVLDLNLPGLNGFQIAKKIETKTNPVKIIYLTMHRGEDLLQEAIRLGAKGFLLKESPLKEVLKGIRNVSEGKTFIGSNIEESIILKNIFELAEVGETKKLLLQKLTQTEIKILSLIAQQKTSKEISEELFVAYKTVEKHRSNICVKLKLTGNNALLKFALENKNIF